MRNAAGRNIIHMYILVLCFTDSVRQCQSNTRYTCILYCILKTHIGPLTSCLLRRNLPEAMRRLPGVVVGKKLVRPLLKRFVVEEELACELVLPHLLTPKTKGTSANISLNC